MIGREDAMAGEEKASATVSAVANLRIRRAFVPKADQVN
jgi:hypothetical protein